MTSYNVTGNTFAIRPLLQSWGGRWDHASKSWAFDELSDVRVAALKSQVGIIVNATRIQDSAYRAFLRAITNKPFVGSTYTGETIKRGDDETYFNYFKDQNPIAFFGFSSLSAFVDYVAALERPNNENGYYDGGWRESEKAVASRATANMAEALRIARDGWSDGLDLAQKFDIPHAKGKRRSHGMAGGSVNVGRMLAGNPAHMRIRKPAPRNKSITLFVECVMWKGITATNAIMRALLIAGMIDVLESEGYSCEIIAVSSTLTLDWKPSSQLVVKLKDAGQRLNLLDISFALGHPSFLRRLEFACIGTTPEIAMSRENPGIISESFNDEWPTGPNEFYVPQLTGQAQRALTHDPFSMLQFIEPDGLPVRIRS